MSDLFGFVLGLIAGGAVVLVLIVKLSLGPLMDECELNLPRTQKCTISAIPVLEKAK